MVRQDFSNIFKGKLTEKNLNKPMLSRCISEKKKIDTETFFKSKRIMGMLESQFLKTIIENIDDDNIYIANMQQLELDINNLDISKFTKNIVNIQGEFETTEIFPLVQYFFWCKNTGEVKVELSDRIDYSGIGNWIRKYNCPEVFTFNSFYTIKIYELLVDNNFFEVKDIIFTENEIREKCDCLNKYMMIYLFKTHVINCALKELKEKLKMDIKCEYVKKGAKRKVTSFHFVLLKN